MRSFRSSLSGKIGPRELHLQHPTADRHPERRMRSRQHVVSAGSQGWHAISVSDRMRLREFVVQRDSKAGAFGNLY